MYDVFGSEDTFKIVNRFITLISFIPMKGEAHYADVTTNVQRFSVFVLVALHIKENVIFLLPTYEHN